MAIPASRGTPLSRVNNRGLGFLPAAFHGTDFSAARPLRNPGRPAGVDATTDEAIRRFLDRFNHRHQQQYSGDSELAVRISRYQLAARMQLSIPDVGQLSTESASTLKMYGADDTENTLKASFANLYSRNQACRKEVRRHR